MENEEVLSTPPRQLVPAQPLHWLDDDTAVVSDPCALPYVAYVGRVRVPIAGPYQPWARLYVLPDGRHVWAVRLWEVDRVVRRLTSTAMLLRFARVSRLWSLESRVRALDRRSRSAP